MDFTVANGSVKVVEFGWQELEFDINGKKYLLEFETRETPTAGERNEWVVEFRDKHSEKLAKRLNIVIDEQFKADLYHSWQKYSEANFRGC